ncbi:calmodulin-like [Physella acuta]|uniref:calmodulin-like n=1 Tax=Physella acuta TaxID=109671 RepID=UPI0027DDD7A8|nr:calmodulin-like [Physella acuta]
MLTLKPVLLVMLIPALVLAQDEASKGNEIFNELDTDASGDLSVLELQAAFDKYDFDVNGNVTWEEYLNYIVSQDPKLEYSLRYLFDVYDFNGDWILNLDDYKHLHAAIDVNRDGQDNRQEFITWSKDLFTAADALPKSV